MYLENMNQEDTSIGPLLGYVAALGLAGLGVAAAWFAAQPHFDDPAPAIEARIRERHCLPQGMCTFKAVELLPRSQGKGLRARIILATTEKWSDAHIKAISQDMAKAFGKTYELTLSVEKPGHQAAAADKSGKVGKAKGDRP